MAGWFKLKPGLFAPRAGQQFRDEQRRRRSQYDRGTRLAELEYSNGCDDYGRFGMLDGKHTHSSHPSV